MKGWLDKKKGAASHLLFSPEFIEHVLDLQFPVLLQGVEGVLRHLLLHLSLQGHQLSQDGAEIRSAVGVLVPALCHTDSRQSPKVRHSDYYNCTLSCPHTEALRHIEEVQKEINGFFLFL